MQECLTDGLPNGFVVMLDFYAPYPREFKLTYLGTVIAKGVEFIHLEEFDDFTITYYVTSDKAAVDRLMSAFRLAIKESHKARVADFLANAEVEKLERQKVADCAMAEALK